MEVGSRFVIAHLLIHFGHSLVRFETVADASRTLPPEKLTFLQILTDLSQVLWSLLESQPTSGSEVNLEMEVDVLARYAETRTLLSGWANEIEQIAGEAAWVRARHGAGTVHLFGFRPQYRSWSQGGFHLLLRAMVLD